MQNNRVGVQDNGGVLRLRSVDASSSTVERVVIDRKVTLKSVIRPEDEDRTLSLTEVDTKRQWVDGKNIYRIVATQAMANHTSSTALDTTIHTGGGVVDTLIKMDVLVSNGSTHYVGSHEDLNSFVSYREVSGNGVVRNLYDGNWSSYTATYVLEYTKQ